MDLPITRPSTISYADELDFPELLKDLSTKKHNGFIRVTYGSEEGFILFKDGKAIAASYERNSRVDAIEKIKGAMLENSTLIEVFDVKPTQIDFYMDMNKPYLLGTEASVIIDELKGLKKDNEPVPEPKVVPKAEPVSEPKVVPKVEPVSEPKVVPKVEPVSEPSTESEIVTKPEKVKEEITSDEPVENTVPDTKPATETTNEDNSEKETVNDNKESKSKIPTNDENIVGTVPDTTKSESNNDSTKSNTSNSELSTDKSDNETKSVTEDSIPESEDNKSEETTAIEDMPPMDRSELMKKYGIKDIQKEDVENILESYKGGYVSDDDVEKIELTLMNKIKKSILGIPKIRGAEVMVFLDNADGLTGNVNIIIESESKGFLSRIMGESKDINLERQIINIAEIEIRKSFRKYPEIVDKFDVNVEIS